MDGSAEKPKRGRGRGKAGAQPRNQRGAARGAGPKALVRGRGGRGPRGRGGISKAGHKDSWGGGLLNNKKPRPGKKLGTAREHQAAHAMVAAAGN